MKKIGFGMAVILVIISLSISIAVCAETIVLSMAPGSCPPPPASGGTLGYVNMANLIETKTNGRVKINIYWGNTLVKSADCITAVQKGIADMAEIAPHYEPGKVPLSLVGQLPGIGKDMWARAQAYNDLIKQEPIVSELAKYNMLPLFTHLLTAKIVLSTVPIRTLADFKGKKLATSGITTGVVVALGGVPISMSPPEQYEGLQKGIVDGAIGPTAMAWDFKFYEVSKYYITFDMGPVLTPVVINKDSWSKLPADAQKIFTDSSTIFTRFQLDGFVEDGDPKAVKAMKDAKIEFIEPGEAEKAELQKVEFIQAQKWAEDQEKKGLQGKKVLDDFVELVKKYEASAKK